MRIVNTYWKTFSSALFAVFLVLPSYCLANATDVATCRNPTGWAFYHSGGLVPKGVEGWRKDEINPGSFRLQRLANGDYDISVTDANQSPFSLRGDGGEVIFMRSGPDNATFLHFFKGKVIELYTFWVSVDGKLRFDLIQSKGGATSPVHKSAVMVGDCSSIKFELLK